ncbi:hypothetical protein [Amycolatopsis sp. GM8]|uniref:hypothetical protein n=1 Tax=Amycolatopsis sp. GM8 TaxID=2896530 RepID=UPI001F3E6E4E|nr:hypothetical protein [Amycolatopsis sp. GM8]
MTHPTPPPGTETDAVAASLDDRVEAALDTVEELVDRTLPALVARIEAVEGADVREGVGRRAAFRFNHPFATGNPVGPQEAVQAWHRLHRWVEWLAGQARLSAVIPPCWPLHPLLVLDLTALFLAWENAWTTRASADAPLAFQERLDRARVRWADPNWGTPHCDGTHDPSGLDNADLFRSWVEDKWQRRAFSIAVSVIVARLRGTGGER